MNPIELIKLLADGKFHSGQAIADHFQVSRTAVWKAVGRVSQWGLQIDSVRGRGYRVRPKLELMDDQLITTALSPKVQALLGELIVLPLVDSTNQYLKAFDYPEQIDAAKKAWVCLAEYQHQGRGRRGRSWHAAYACSALVSIAWRFPALPPQINLLSLIVGVAVVDALQRLGIDGLKLKWPNDIYWQERKLGGILFELFGEEQGSIYAIAGIGLNLQATQVQADQVDQPWIALTDDLADLPVNRNQLLAALINQVCESFEHFEQNQIDDYLQRWQKFDLSYGQAVKLTLPNQEIIGEAMGVDAQGRLLLKTEQGINAYASGEVSVRIES